MSIALSPLAGLACWLIYAGHQVVGAVLFVILVLFGNWFVWFNSYRKPKTTEVKR